jgi:UDP-N-acetylglucosamine 2-epimerase
MLKIATVVGARPQFIKAAPVSWALRAAGHREVLIHTGQHYDRQLSQVFFDELGIPAPDLNLGIGSGTHGWQTGQMLLALEPALQSARPDWVLCYGDTNSTLAAALAACKLQLPLAHVEAGLRSFNRTMPEEHNRVLTDHCADLLFCPTRTAVEQLAREGLAARARLVGDTMLDALLAFAERARARSTVLRDLGLAPGGYILATIHRPYNTDIDAHLAATVAALTALEQPVVFPVHPRTRARLSALGLEPAGADAARLRLVEPVGYLDMLALEQHAAAILTDSGGVQKEAYFFGVPCITLRPETEWVETIAAGWNVLVAPERDAIVAAAARAARPAGAPPPVFGDGQAAGRIVATLEREAPAREAPTREAPAPPGPGAP